jgi:hypothetical protein
MLMLPTVFTTRGSDRLIPGGWPPTAVSFDIASESTGGCFQNVIEPECEPVTKIEQYVTEVFGVFSEVLNTGKGNDFAQRTAPDCMMHTGIPSMIRLAGSS